MVKLMIFQHVQRGKEHTRDQKAREVGQTKIPCVQSREYDHGKDFSSTFLQPWHSKAAGGNRGGKCCLDPYATSHNCAPC